MRERAGAEQRWKGGFPAISSLIAVALVLAQIATVGHYALVAHYACAEHGTVHHGDAEHAASKPAEPERGPALVDGEAAHGAHDECAYPARRASSLSPPNASVELVLVPHVERVAAARATFARAHGLPLLALAPKLPPPASV